MAQDQNVALRCRECGTQGALLPISGVHVNGRPLTVVPQLPRCGCFLRGHRGQLPPAIASLMADAPELPEHVAQREAMWPSAGARDPADPTPAARSGVGPPDNAARRLSHSAKQLVSREVMVYLSECTEQALLGSIVITGEHKLSDVVTMLRDQLDVLAAAELYRGTLGQKLRVPLHKRQLKRPALPFFQCEAHHLLVEEKTDAKDP